MRRAVIALLIGAVFVAACDDDDDDNLFSGVPVTLNGAFALRSVRDVAIPAPVTLNLTGNGRIVALSGRISIFGDGRFTSRSAFQRTLGGVDSTLLIDCKGTWTAVINKMTFVEEKTEPNCGAVFEGIRTGDDLVTVFLGAPALYTR
ncbi:MAG TPA: hypothetical protein VIP11_18700 [Gemmatimonadaceae bacterium]